MSAHTPRPTVRHRGPRTSSATTFLTLVPDTATPAPAPARAKRHIAPLDGLRGLAVLGVLFYHAGHFGGGFLGVDLFFVLSGFLITGLLLNEARQAAATGRRVDLVAFWGRRARRLLPALATTLAGTLLLVWALGPADLLRNALDDAPWVVANLANWHFIADRIGYWDAADTRVFSHLWSIAVEEQFYLVWPLLLALLATGGRLVRTRSHQRHSPALPDVERASARAGRRVAAVAGLGAVASLVLMISMAPLNPDTTRVYEGTDTRAFALLLGALMATDPARTLLSRLGERMSGWLGLVLAAGIAGYWFVIDGEKSPSLFQGALFAHSLAAALLIACLAHAPGSAVGRVLGAGPLRWVGQLSYSLYLWHWPVLLLLSEERTGLTGWSRTALALAVSFAAAIASKYLIEDPIRFRARWAHGRTGFLAVAATFVALIALWYCIPEPPAPGTGSVDLTQLTG
ncbi:acyltransferase [Streptomyces sp. NBC_00237]|uniref:acyltransferase family protein n=1 Tax=Streptomyces sp. NBC_00237 TaxID=2975687 RepID=UPI002259E81F|nr:acyltransferase [Streptomyces sp. NBC_00237]MCX5205662.1 acyltransferase [Streptomyces sp. NBC_00237]